MNSGESLTAPVRQRLHTESKNQDKTPVQTRRKPAHFLGPLPGDERDRRPLFKGKVDQRLVANFDALPDELSPQQIRRRLTPMAQGYLELDIALRPQLEDRVARAGGANLKPKPFRPRNQVWMWQFDLLWVFAILVYGIGDLASTSWALSLGASELNPFLHPVLGKSLWNFIVFKAMVLVSLMLISTWLISIGSDARAVPALTMLVGLFLTANNIVVSLGLLGQL